MTRGQNAVHVLPVDWSIAQSVLSTLVDRLDAARPETQLLVITADAESAATAAAAFVETIGERAIRVIAATSSPRAARLLRTSPAHVVVGTPADLSTLLQASALKGDSVRGVLFAWLDPILDTAEAQLLETLLNELPKEGARVVLASEMTPAYEALIERYARRARRAVDAPAEVGVAQLSAEYVSTAPSARIATLRRLLDALDLPRAVLYARSDAMRRDAITVARSLGYPADALRLAAEGEPASPDPVVFLELPPTRESLRAIVGAGARKLYALVQPSQLASLRQLLGGGMLTPLSLIEAAERARGRDAALRASLRDVLTSGDVRREVLALEPLLAEFDGIEIAAAALRMLEQQRPQRATVAASSQAGPMQRLFVNLGEKDGIRAQEIITAITTEAGIPGSQIGKVEVRETHSLVEVASSVAELVAGKISGAVVRGRKVQARLDTPKEDRPARSGPPARGGDRPARPFDRSGPPRGDRPTRPGAPRSGPPRGDRPDRGDRPARPFDRSAGGGPPRKFDREGGTGRPTRPRPPRDGA